MARLGEKAVSTAATVEAYRPTLILTPLQSGPLGAQAAAWSQRGIEVIEVDPHGFADSYEILKAVARHLGLEADARKRIRELADPLGRLSTESLGRRRPRVIPIASLEPLELAGGHSSLTDLILIAGADSTTHDLDIPRVAVEPESLSGMGGELMLIALPGHPDRRERARAAALAPAGVQVEFIVIENENFWLGRPIEVACDVWRKLRVLQARQGPARGPEGACHNIPTRS